MPRYALTENEFRTIESLITYKPRRGRPPTKIRETFDAILWILCSGAPWRDLPGHYPPWKSVYHRFRYYQRHGILERVVEALMQRANKNRKIQLTLVCIDGSYIRAHRHAAGAPKKKDRPSKKPGRNRPLDVLAAATPRSST